MANNDIKTARDLQFINTNMFEILFKNGKKLIKAVLENIFLFLIYLNHSILITHGGLEKITGIGKKVPRFLAEQLIFRIHPSDLITY